MSSYRIKRVNEVIRRELADSLPKLLVIENTLLTVTDVDVASDLKTAEVFLSFIGGSAEQQQSVFNEVLKKRGEIQEWIGKRVVLKYTPQLHFKRDYSAERGTRLMQLLDDLDNKTDQA